MLDLLSFVAGLVDVALNWRSWLWMVGFTLGLWLVLAIVPAGGFQIAAIMTYCALGFGLGVYLMYRRSVDVDHQDTTPKKD